MKDNINQDLPNSSEENSGKNTNNSDSKHLTERQKFYFFLKKKTATVYQVEKEIRISRANGCRYKTYYQNLGLLQVVKIGRCPITSQDGVQFITTNEMWFKDEIQLKLFKP